ncbi:MAG: ferritin family protein [bacterium]|nr:ferritin family protein [bacterium]
MSKTKEQIAATLKTAIRGEEDGYKFYDLVAKKATNPEAKRKLEGLRDDEMRHKETLRAFYAKYVGGEVGELPEKGLSVLSDVFRKGHVHDLKSEMEFLNLAIEAELAATKFYQEERNLIDDEEFGKVLDQLADEEHGHFELLQAEKDALGGNYNWFGFDHGTPMEH